MSIFKEIALKGHEQVIYCQDKISGLQAIIAIHNTALGPSLGGCRMWPYASEEEALYDVLRLSRGMTYKSAVAGLHLGGGKAVIIGDPKTKKSPELFKAFGRFVQSLSGRYITAEDVGTSEKDMEYIFEETDYVTGISAKRGGSGNPSPVTAFGVYRGILAANKYKTGSDALSNRVIAVQGTGSVGSHLIDYLIKDGARVVVTDISEESVKRIKDKYAQVEYVSPEEIYDVKCDIFAPCALGACVNSKTIPKLKCEIIAGSANNVLENEDKDIQALGAKGILYIPDYVISAGGIINVASELGDGSQETAWSRTAEIYDTVTKVLQIASEKNMNTVQAANALAESRISEGPYAHTMYMGEVSFNRRA